MPHQSLLDITLAASIRDGQLSSSEGHSVGRLTEGVIVRALPTHADERGSVTELFDPRWNFHPEPIVFAYSFTIRPGHVKGWGLHRDHEDRYAILKGEMELVLFDPRPDSPTCGQICRIVLSEQSRSICNVPKNVWHADRCLGSTDVLVVNFPTKPYDHANPDKFRLPLDTELIPYSFESTKGW